VATIVQVASATADGSNPSATIVAASPGNVLVAVMNYTTRPLPGMGDVGLVVPTGFTSALHSTYTDVAPDGQGAGVFVAYKVAAGGETAVQFGISDASCLLDLVVYELAGINTSSPVDGTVGTAGEGSAFTTVASGSVDNTVADDIAIVGVAVQHSGGVFTPGSFNNGFTDQYEHASHPFSYGRMMASGSKVLSATATQQTTYSFTGGSALYYASALVLFRGTSSETGVPAGLVTASAVIPGPTVVVEGSPSPERVMATVSIPVPSVSAAGSVRNPFLWPFASDSPWNTSMGDLCNYSAEGSEQTVDLRVGNVAINALNWSHPFYQATTSDLLYEIRDRPAGSTGDQSTSTALWNASTFVATIRCPSSAQPAGNPNPTGPGTTANFDRHMHVLQPDGVIHECYATQIDHVNRRIFVNHYATFTVTGSGIKYPGTGSTRASGTAGPAGLITYDELTALDIPHALAFAIDHEQMELGPIWPASAQDSQNSDYNGSINYGTLACIPRSINLATLGLSAAGLALGTCLQKYGAYLVDGSGGFKLYARPECETHPEMVALRAAASTLQNLLVAVTNNYNGSTGTVGGPGTRLGGTAPGFGDPTPLPTTVVASVTIPAPIPAGTSNPTPTPERVLATVTIPQPTLEGGVLVSSFAELVAECRVENNGNVITTTNLTGSPSLQNFGGGAPNDRICGLYIADGTHLRLGTGLTLVIDGINCNGRPIVGIEAGGSMRGDLIGGNRIKITTSRTWVAADHGREHGIAMWGLGATGADDGKAEYVEIERTSQGIEATSGGGRGINIGMGSWIHDWGMHLTDTGGAHAIYGQDRLTIDGLAVGQHSQDANVTTRPEQRTFHMYGNGGGDITVNGLYGVDGGLLIGVGGYRPEVVRFDNVQLERLQGQPFQLGQTGAQTNPIGDFESTNSQYKSGTHGLIRLDDYVWTTGITFDATDAIEKPPAEPIAQVSGGNPTVITNNAASTIAAGAEFYEFWNSGGVARRLYALWKGATLPVGWTQVGSALRTTTNLTVVEAVQAGGESPAAPTVVATVSISAPTIAAVATSPFPGTPQALVSIPAPAVVTLATPAPPTVTATLVIDATPIVTELAHVFPGTVRADVLVYDPASITPIQTVDLVTAYVLVPSATVRGDAAQVGIDTLEHGRPRPRWELGTPRVRWNFGPVRRRT
jgi:hypothetical protein